MIVIIKHDEVNTFGIYDIFDFFVSLCFQLYTVHVEDLYQSEKNLFSLRSRMT
jgi:hypothetical protein